MLTLPVPNSTRSAPPGSSLVVRLALPEDHRGSPRSGASTQLDLHRLARAVEALVRAAAPEIVAEVRVESAGQVRSAPRPTPTPVLDAENLRPELDSTLRLDHVSRSLRIDGRPVLLTRREFELFAYLDERRTVALSRAELMNAVWQTGYLPGDRTIDVHVRRLRMKLGRHAHRLTTLRGFGYRLD